MIVLFGGEKGGTGKTTLAVTIAAMRKALGRDVLLVDSDPQGSASYWCSLREDAYPDRRIPCVQKFGNKVHREVEELARKYEDVIIDAGGRDSAELRGSVLVADRIFTPLKPSQFDVWSLEHMEKLVGEAKMLNRELKAWVVINQASSNPRITEADEAREFLKELTDLTLSDVVIKDRVAFRRAAQEGLCVTELKDKRSKAVLEIRSLYSEVFGDATRV